MLGENFASMWHTIGTRLLPAFLAFMNAKNVEAKARMCPNWDSIREIIFCLPLPLRDLFTALLMMLNGWKKNPSRVYYIGSVMHAGIDGEVKVAESFGEDKQNWVKGSRFTAN